MPATTAKAARPWEAPGKGAPTATLPEAKAPATAPEPAKSNSASMIDEYATVHAEIARLEKLKKKLGDEIKKLGVGEHNGTKCKAVITESTSTRLDTEAIKGAMSDEWIAKFSKTSTTQTLNIKALV